MPTISDYTVHHIFLSTVLIRVDATKILYETIFMQTEWKSHINDNVVLFAHNIVFRIWSDTYMLKMINN